MVRKRVLAPLLLAATLLAFAANMLAAVSLALRLPIVVDFDPGHEVAVVVSTVLFVVAVAVVGLAAAALTQIATDACYFLLVHDDDRVQEYRDLNKTWYWYAVTRIYSVAPEDGSLGGGKN